MDSIFLRDLTPLMAFSPFVYRWSFHVDMANTAVMALPQASREARVLLFEALNMQPGQVDLSAFHPAILSRIIRRHRLPVRLLSSYLFDPIWVRNDGHEVRCRPAGGSGEGAPEGADRLSQPLGAVAYQDTDAFTWEDFFMKDVRSISENATLADLASGAYIFHYHSRFDGNVAPGSFAAMVEGAFAARVLAHSR